MKDKQFRFLMFILRKGFSQSDIARKSKMVSESRLSRLINKYDFPKEAEIAELASILRTSKEEIKNLFKEEGK